MAPQTRGQARKAEEERLTLMHKLKSTHSFKDKSGMTSCATDEIEHYRLRLVGLTKNLELTDTLIPTIKSMPVALQSPSTLSSDAISDAEDFIRERIAGYETTRKHLEAEHEDVLALYIKLFYQRLYSNLLKLPLELKQMIYGYLLDTDGHVQMLRYETTTRRSEGKIGYYDSLNCRPRLDAPLICKPSEVDPEVAKEALETFYRITHFQLQPLCVQRSLDEQVWGAVDPKDFVRLIDIDLPRFRPIKEPQVLDEIRFQLSALKSLKAGRLEIGLTIKSPKYQTMTSESITAAAQRASVKNQRPMSQAWQDMMKEGVARNAQRLREDREWNLRVIMGVLLPDLALLVKKSHLVTLKGEDPYWEYPLDEKKLTIDEMMEDWRASPGKKH